MKSAVASSETHQVPITFETLAVKRSSGRCGDPKAGERAHQRFAPDGLAKTTHAGGGRHRGADHDDWDRKQARIFAYVLNELPAVDTRHRQIGENRDRESCRTPELGERIRTVTSFQQSVPACAKQVAAQGSNIIVVIDDQQDRAYARGQAALL